jgi:hypothetical protein
MDRRGVKTIATDGRSPVAVVTAYAGGFFDRTVRAVCR